MVEELLVKDVLTKEMVEGGRELVQHLDRAKIKVTSALWFFISESNTWKLLIASPEVNRTGPRKLYEKIVDVLSEIPAQRRLTLSHIQVVQNNDPIVSSLRSGIKTGKNLSGVGVYGSTYVSQYIDAAFIYRST